MDQENLTLTSIRVSRFAHCHCGKAPYGDEHLAIGTFATRLHNDSAVAISYGIGDFDRQPVLAGHRDNNPAEPVRFALGGEWIVADFLAALVKLSDRKGGLWFDQLSIPQQPGEIAQQLQNVPNIYATLEVVILLPHSPCPCLGEAVRSCETPEADGNTAFRLLPLILGKCPVAWPFASYFSRLWTKLELKHSCELSIAYCSGPATMCFQKCPEPSLTSTAGVYKLAESSSPGRYLEYLHRQLNKHSWRSSDVSMKQTRAYCSTLLFGFIRDVQDIYLGRPYSSDQRLIAKLLLGHKLQRPRVPPRSLQPIIPDVFNAIQQATVPADLVTAIFVTHSQYNIPLQCSKMTIPELLENAISQIEIDWVYLPKLPQGLFSALSPDRHSTGSMLCRPTLYLGAEQEVSLHTLYSPLCGGIAINLDHGITMLHIRTTQAARRSKMLHARSYQNVFGSSCTRDVFEYLCSMPPGIVHGFLAFARGPFSRQSAFSFGDLSHWSEWAGQVGVGDREPPHEQWPNRMCERAMLLGALREYYTNNKPYRNWSNCELSEIDHYDAVYTIMCGTARVDPWVARSAGIKLVLQTGPDTTAIGLVNRRAYRLLCEDQLAQSSQSHVGKSDAQTLGDSRRWLSVAAREPMGEYIPRVYETLRVADGDEGHPAFEAGRRMPH